MYLYQEVPGPTIDILLHVHIQRDKISDISNLLKYIKSSVLVWLSLNILDAYLIKKEYTKSKS